CQKYSTSPLTF
nr:immunoglobulin light chain junction region [Macaca mulatta]MOX88442.1 immunoglobulin light chain junction region [Macaca mulatta]